MPASDGLPDSAETPILTAMSAPFSLLFRGVLFSLIALLAINPALSSESPKEKEPDPILGRWRWIGKQIVTCHEDHKMTVTPTNRTGTWRSVPSKTNERKYELTWDEGLYVDQLTMSKDLKSLKGKNQKGEKIEGTKIE